MKVNLRELFLAVLVVALALGWWLDRQRFARPDPQPSAPLPQTGRWELVVGKNGQEVLFDTATGDVWTHSNYGWEHRPTPAKKSP
jgi:hypothetical protein